MRVTVLVGIATDDEPRVYSSRTGAVRALLRLLSARGEYEGRRGCDPDADGEPHAEALIAFVGEECDSVGIDDLRLGVRVATLSELEVR